jgi:hypothetical protein
VSFDYDVARGGTRFKRLSAKRVPRGAAITLSCRGGGCPFKSRRVVRSAKRANYALLRSSLRLRPGARLELRITAPDGSVLRRTFTIRRGKAPKRTTRCREGASRRFGACG